MWGELGEVAGDSGKVGLPTGTERSHPKRQCDPEGGTLAKSSHKGTPRDTLQGQKYKGYVAGSQPKFKMQCDNSQTWKVDSVHIRSYRTRRRQALVTLLLISIYKEIYVHSQRF